MSLGERIKNFYTKSITHSPSTWMVLECQKDYITQIIMENKHEELLKKFGNNKISMGVNCVDYHAFTDHCAVSVIDDTLPKYSKIVTHILGQEKLYTSLTGLSTQLLEIPNKYEIVGKKCDNNNIIPITSYRIGYNASHIISILSKMKNEIRPVILELGGGWGVLPNILSNFGKLYSKNFCYIIVDLPSTGILSAYFLITMGKKVCLYGEYDNGESFDKLVQKYDFIIIPSQIIEQIPNNFCDITINTASLPEMNPNTIYYYINHINRITKGYFYYDNRTFEFNAPTLQKACNEIIKNKFNLVLKQETPINYMYPPLWGTHITQFEERLYKSKLLC